MIDAGPQGKKQLIGMYRAAYPDMHYAVEDQIAEGDRVVTRWIATGTHQGDLLSMAPTGKLAKVMAIWIHYLAGGTIVQSLNVWDTLGMLHGMDDCRGHRELPTARERTLADSFVSLTSPGLSVPRRIGRASRP
jgi:hypothetical protein